MSNQLLIQVISTLGIIIFVPVLYMGLLNDAPTIAQVSVAVFGVCLLLTPLMRLFARRN